MSKNPLDDLMGRGIQAVGIIVAMSVALRFLYESLAPATAFLWALGFCGLVGWLVVWAWRRRY